ncbi:MAG: hypothetical protein WB779_04810 [Ignavibacteriaceae bacterium]|jgi:hypothetical protein
MAGSGNELGKTVIKSREELIEECLEIGIPVIGHEDRETLKMFLGSADDDFVDDPEGDDGFEDGPSDDDEIFDEDFDFDEDDEDDLFEDDDVSYN